jgi:hypothetical protein
MINYTECITKAYPGITADDFALQQNDDGSLVILNWNVTKYGTCPTLTSLDHLWLGIAKVNALSEIKDIRKQGLDKAALSAGILAIYNTNYEAAVEYLADRPTTLMKNGMTAEAYLAGFGTKLNMTARQFATYIVAENLRVGPTVYDIEAYYLALAYGGDATKGIVPVAYLPTELAVITAVSNFKSYCGV